MRLKIVGGPQSYNTRIVDADTGEELEDVISVSFHAEVGCVNAAVIHIANVEIDVMCNEVIKIKERRHA